MSITTTVEGAKLPWMKDPALAAGGVIRPVSDFFPLGTAREKQAKAIAFINEAINRGYKDIVIAAPTGIGKSAIGAAVCLWAGQFFSTDEYESGGYYLVTQKMLQDQLQEDIRHYRPELRDAASVKSATEYPCSAFETCMVGKRVRRKITDSNGEEKMAAACDQIRHGHCPYRMARRAYKKAKLAITNYPFFFVDSTYVGAKRRRVMVLDECHSTEAQILGHIELAVNPKEAKEWAPALILPKLPTLNDFYFWIRDNWFPLVKARLEMEIERLRENDTNRKLHNSVNKLENYVGRCTAALDSIAADPKNWVYWQEEVTEKNEVGDMRVQYASTAKPIEAGPFMKQLLLDYADVRIYMSAYPGPKEVFCRSLGLNPDNVALASYGSTFPPENRPIHLMLIGSMGQRHIAETTPSVLRQICRIAKAHKDSRGIIHSNSYSLGKQIYDALVEAGLGDRVLYPISASERAKALEIHSKSTNHTIMISPSMTEGFNFVGDLARWQILAKCPWPNLLDKQISAKQQSDPDWYVMQTCMTILQSCGRAVRSESDSAVTYILDKDFERLYRNHQEFFPLWFRKSFKWH